MNKINYYESGQKQEIPLKIISDFYIKSISACFYNCCTENRNPIPEESQSINLPKRGLQLLTSKQSPKPARNHHSNKPTTSLLTHNTSSDSENSDLERGKLMKPKQQKKTFSLGESDEDDDELQTKRT